ncbi:MAG: hypothetical protein R3D26_18680 [Cyanobacteriota/Melainabacteria group bacterium]
MKSIDSIGSNQESSVPAEVGLIDWLVKNVWKPLSSGAFHEPGAAISVASGLKTMREARDDLHDSHVQPNNVAEVVTQSLAYGVGMVIPYGAAILLVRTPLRTMSGILGRQSTLAGRILDTQSTSVISGATAYDAFRLPEGNETRLSNAVEGLITFSLLDGGNRLLSKRSFKGRLVGLAGIGVVAGFGQETMRGALTKDEVTPSTLLEAMVSTAAINTVLSPVLIKNRYISRSSLYGGSDGYNDSSRKLLEVSDLVNPPANAGHRSGIANQIDAFISSLPGKATDIALGYGAGSHRALTPLAQRQQEMLGFVQKDRQVFGADSPYRIRNLLELGESYLKESRDPVAARRYFDETFRLLDRNLYTGSVDRQKAYRELGGFYQEIGQDKIAIHSFEKVLGSKTKDDFTVQDSALFRNTADLYGRSGNKSKAIKLIQEGNHLSALKWEPTSERYSEELRASARSLNELGESRLASQFDRHALLVEAVVTMEKAVGREHPLLVRELTNLAEFMDNSGMGFKSATIKERASMNLLLKKTKGPDYPELPDDLKTIAAFYRRSSDTGDAVAAHRLEQRAKAILERRKNRS